MEIAQIVASTADIVARAAPFPSRPTPCADWDVRALTGHVFQVVTALDLAGRGGPVPAGLWSRTLTGADFAAAAAAWEKPPTGEVDLGGMPLAAETAGTMLAADLVLHGWDLARATGQEPACTAGAAEMTCRFLAGFGAQGRARGLFAEPVPVAADAPPLHRALALSGRNPAWRAVTR